MGALNGVMAYITAVPFGVAAVGACQAGGQLALAASTATLGPLGPAAAMAMLSAGITAGTVSHYNEEEKKAANRGDGNITPWEALKFKPLRDVCTTLKEEFDRTNTKYETEIMDRKTCRAALKRLHDEIKNDMGMVPMSALRDAETKSD